MGLCDPSKTIAAVLLTASLTLTGGAARAADEPKTGEAAEETKTGDAEEAGEEKSPHCENVEIVIKNTSGGTIKLISIDYATGRTWKRGRIIFRTIDDGASHSWKGSFKDLAGKQIRYRVNTRYVLNALTDTYSDLNSTVVSTAECESEEQHEVTIGKASG